MRMVLIALEVRVGTTNNCSQYSYLYSSNCKYCCLPSRQSIHMCFKDKDAYLSVPLPVPTVVLLIQRFEEKKRPPTQIIIYKLKKATN